MYLVYHTISKVIIHRVYFKNTQAPRHSLFEMPNPGLCGGAQTAQLGLRRALSFKGLGVTDSDLRLMF